MIENTPSLWQKDLKKPGPDDHKYTRGHLVVIGGSEMTGAPRLAAYAARRMGCGMVSLFCEEKVWSIYASGMPGLVVKKITDFEENINSPKIHGFVIGPGFLTYPKSWIEAILRTNKPVVIDAGALNVSLDFHEKCVLTPHQGEFKTLFGDVPFEQALAQVGSACLLLKGSTTLVGQGHQIVSHPNGSPYLATAGTGDVLAGMIGSLMVQGMSALNAASCAVWVHSKAAESYGYGLIAEDLADLFPTFLK